MIKVKILSLGEAERYAVRRLVLVAQHDLQAQGIRVDLTIKEINNASEIGKFASTLVQPTLMINDKVVCSGRFPKKEEMIKWLVQADNPEPIPALQVQDPIKE